MQTEEILSFMLVFYVTNLLSINRLLEILI